MRFPALLSSLAIGFLVAGSTALLVRAQTPPTTNTDSPPAARRASDPDRSVAAFRKMTLVLRSPRCLNCHPATDFPKEGDDGRRHDMAVQRGPANRGVIGMECRTCHQAVNVDAAPGAPGWELAPRSMAWEGLTDHQLAEALKDPARNGPRSLEQLYDHMANNELVGWAWHPGGKREIPPMSREEFTRAVREWIDTGAVSPKP